MAAANPGRLTTKQVVEGGWVHKSFYGTGWSDERKCRGCNRQGTERHGLYQCPSWKEVRNQIPEGLGTLEQRANTPTEAWEWQRGTTAHSLSEEQPVVGPQGGNRKSSNVGVCQWNASVTVSPPMALCWESRVGGRVRMVSGAA